MTTTPVTPGAPKSGSTTFSQMPLYGRKYQIQVLMPPDASGTKREVLTIADSAFEPESLRVTFDVRTDRFQTFWTAEVVIYNLDQATTHKLLALGQPGKGQSQPLIAQGMEVVISAGYQNGKYGVIFTGPVFQPLWERENVTDFKLTLSCILGVDELTRGFVSGTYSDLVSQTDLLRRLADNSYAPLKLVSVPDSLGNAKRFPRGKVVFGSPKKYFDQIARDNGMQWWLDEAGLSMGGLAVEDKEAVSQEPVLVFSPSTGLIGTPQQTQEGASFTLLLDPRIRARKPAMQVKLDNSVIRTLKRQLGDYYLWPLDQDLFLVVAGVRHYGDTRGQAWYTEVTGVTAKGGFLEVRGINQ